MVCLNVIICLDSCLVQKKIFSTLKAKSKEII